MGLSLMYGISVVSVRLDHIGRTIMKTQMGSCMWLTQLTTWDSKNAQKSCSNFSLSQTSKMCHCLSTLTSKILNWLWMLQRLWSPSSSKRFQTEHGTCRLALQSKKRGSLRAWNGSLKPLVTRNEHIYTTCLFVKTFRSIIHFAIKFYSIKTKL